MTVTADTRIGQPGHLQEILWLAQFEQLAAGWDARQGALDTSGAPQAIDRASNWAELLTPALTAAFFIGFSNDGRRQSMIPQLFNVQTSQRAWEQFMAVGTLGSEGWNFEDSGRVQYDEHKRGFPTTFTHAEFAKGLMVQRKLVDDNLTDVKLDEAGQLGDSAFRKREKGAASIFNNAFTASGVNPDGFSNAGPDGVALVSASHPLSAEDSTVQSNYGGANALSASQLSTSRVAHMRMKDDRGDLMDVMPDELIGPPELEDTMAVVTKSVLDPASNNNAINPQTGRFRSIVWHYLTDTNNWFLTDSARRRRSLLWFDRIPIEFAREEDFDTFIAKFRAYMRYSYGWRDYAWILGHNP
jgi:hypothetical protein